MILHVTRPDGSSKLYTHTLILYVFVRCLSYPTLPCPITKPALFDIDDQIEAQHIIVEQAVDNFRDGEFELDADEFEEIEVEINDEVDADD